MSEIKHYVNSPEVNARTAPELKLYRPVIKYRNAVLFAAAHVLAAFVIGVIVYYAENKTLTGCIAGACRRWWILPVLFLLTLRFTAIWCVRLYQRYAKSEVRLRCVMTPSCSQYSILAFKKYGAVIGLVMTFRRLMRCKPPGYVDYP